MSKNEREMSPEEILDFHLQQAKSGYLVGNESDALRDVIDGLLDYTQAKIKVQHRKTIATETGEQSE